VLTLTPLSTHTVLTLTSVSTHTISHDTQMNDTGCHVTDYTRGLPLAHITWASTFSFREGAPKDVPFLSASVSAAVTCGTG
jgi:hypothetical protein